MGLLCRDSDVELRMETLHRLLVEAEEHDKEDATLLFGDILLLPQLLMIDPVCNCGHIADEFSFVSVEGCGESQLLDKKIQMQVKNQTLCHMQ